MKSFQEHATRFKLHNLKENQNKNQSALFVCYHQIRTNLIINKIRQHQNIQAYLKNIKLQTMIMNGMEP